MALEAVIEPDQGGADRRVFAGQPLDVAVRQPGDGGDFRHRILAQRPLAQLIGPETKALQVIVILQAIAPQDVHDSQGQGGVGAGADRQPPVAARSRLAAVGVDGDDAGAGLAGLVHQRPQVNVGDAGVGAPVDDVAAVDHGLGVDGGAGAERDIAACGPGGGADGAVQERGAQAVEEAAVQAGALQLAHRAGVAVRQDRLRPVGGAGDLVEALGDGRDGLVPGDARELARATFWQRKPWVKGCSRSPRSRTAWPSSTVTTMPQVSGQSWGQTARTIFSSARGIRNSAYTAG